MANNGPAFTRLGPGDLPGDPNHPNSPDYVEPAFGMDDAVGSVVQDMDETDMCELVQEAIDCRALFDWLAHNVEIPAAYLPAFRSIDLRARNLNKSVEAAYERMNAPFQPDDDE